MQHMHTDTQPCLYTQTHNIDSNTDVSQGFDSSKHLNAALFSGEGSSQLPKKCLMLSMAIGLREDPSVVHPREQTVVKAALQPLCVATRAVAQV